MSIPFMFQIPGTSDPDAPSVIEIIKAIQNGLKKLGYKRVQASGVFDRETAAAVSQISGPWRQQTWLEISGNVLAAMRDPDRKARQMAMAGLGDFEELAAFRGYGPIPGSMVGLPAGPMGQRFTGELLQSLGDFTMISSSKGPIARPTDLKTLGEFQGVQRAINLGRAKKGLSLISVDGDIGPGTVSAAASVQFTFNATQIANSAAVLASTIATAFGGVPNLTPDPAKARVRFTAPPPGSPPGTPPGVDPGSLTAGFADQLGPYGKYILLGLGAAAVAAVVLKKKRKRR
jgi:hypothetical protein